MPSTLLVARCGCQTLINAEGVILLQETCDQCLADALAQIAEALRRVNAQMELLSVKLESESDRSPQS